MNLPPKSRFLTIALISLVTIAYQLLATRVLAFVFWNHVVYLIISIALLGYGVSSTFLAVLYRRIRDLPEALFLAANLILFAATAVAGLLALGFLQVDLYDVVGTSVLAVVLSVVPLLLAYLMFLLPFFFSGNVVVYLFYRYPAAANRLYFFDLTAAALGCLLFVALITRAGAVGGILLLALLTLGGAAVLLGPCLRADGDRPGRRGARLLLVSAAVLAAAIFGLHLGQERVFRLPNDSAKVLSVATGERNPGAEVEYSAWDVVSRMDVVDGGGAPLDLGWTVIQAPHKLVSFDGDAISHIPHYAPEFPTAEDVAAFEATSHFWPLLHDAAGGDHLVIGLGGGPDLATALQLRGRSITGVEINGALVKAMRGRFAEFNGNLWNRPQVRIVHSEGRSFLRRAERAYDLIFMSGVDTFTALSTGAYVMAENYLYTQEAVDDYTSHLTDDGTLFILRWFFSTRPRESLRLFATVLESLRDQGVERPADHLLVLRYQHGFSPGLTLVRKRPYGEAETAEILRRMAADHPDFRFAYLPHAPSSWAHHALAESRYFLAVADAYREGREQEFFDLYPYDVEPVGDDRPFFFKYYKLQTLLKETWGSILGTGPIHGYWSYLVLVILLVAASLAVTLFIWTPLVRFRRDGISGRGSAWATLYFAALGLGFIMLEIVLMQKFALFLGHPMHSISTVLASMLLFAGVGSRLAERWVDEPVRGVSLAFFGVVAMILVFAFAGDAFVDALLGAGLGWRIAACAAAVAPLALALGVFFPLGLRIVERRNVRYVPWAWGINSGFTVIGSILAIMVAMAVGFNTVMLAVAVIYGGGVLAIRRYEAG